jgi:signal transduction histidine kinase
MRAKLVVAGVSTSIAALSILAIVAFFITKDAISESVMNGLSAVATNQRQQIELQLAHHRADLESISGDTQVTQSLRHFIATNDQVDRLVLNQMLTDRAANSDNRESYDLLDMDGHIVASSEPGHIGNATFDPTDEKFVVTVKSDDPTDSDSHVRLSHPIVFDGRNIGYATVHFDTIELNDIVTRYLGRRETGESLLVSRGADEEIRFLTTLRFNDSGAFYQPVNADGNNRVEIYSLSGRSGSGTDFVDYRGKQVFGVYHYIEDANFGLTVKMDQSEALSSLEALSRGLVLVIILISIAIVLIAVVIARHFIDPISRLTYAADQFSRGQLSSRVSIESTDEIGTLGQTFNIMAASLQTANDELETRVEARTADLRRSNQDLEQFAYVASHDLQEPLRMVSSYTQLLSRRYTGKLDDDADEFIGYAVDGAKRMQTLINDLLTYSRSGRQEEVLEDIATGDIVEQAVANLGSRIEDAHATINVDNLPTVVADQQQLISIFQNLISNAIKYRSPAKNPVVDISAERTSGVWRFTIKDNGIGIDPAFSDRIFTIFQRLHGRDEYQGTGIGLAVVKKIVERSGGRIWVQSVPDEGSSLIFTLIDRQSEVNSTKDGKETNESKENGRNNLRAAS